MINDSYDYTHRQGVHPISWHDFHGICKALAQAVANYDPDVILPIGRGGYYPGTLLAHILRVELYPVRVSRRVDDVVVHKQPRWLIEPPAWIKGKRVLIVDEICSRGETIAIVKEKATQLGADAIKSAVLYSHSWGTAVPDYIGLVSDALLLNPWDREIFKDNKFQFHPEYMQAFATKGIEPETSFTIQATPINLAKG